ncbi:hypothetical protein BKA70DRAFT_1254076 [Coprinopsis sp. MPI-PUGE-AT-0042]|nr:hypothetical protein BKA70DRAFT_1339436 [Coprinopsis sp. MPI-PUGE-AT-0042]KAH6885115.1 hypothetical protein BKA70DRAFT_1338253 [Coprinopsis sp. MPI-PUGE-AT-0042]KAH6894006.1 hypothetical protein BKA70DRAFT_1320266 [Coprinopsis sp. MPI-PUGE-AT-0042]KAH6894885.1 hypothetical protein BKA70DRAFT_1318929 [Coprinopsis sp. MPI-PUGE-AT-0042]KAH6907362.1 hypothetical protein BKA70DRAFT_1285537 [Coprinopsis sp. MPI-PUGE-AT-0042]
MRGSVCEAPALSQTLQKLLERVESLERLTEALRGDVVKATSLASRYKREVDDLSRRFDDATTKNRVQVQDLQHENREIRQQLNQTTRQLNELSDARRLESTQQSDCDIPLLRRRTDELASEGAGLRSKSWKPCPSSPTATPTLPNTAQMDQPGVPLPFPRRSTRPPRSSACQPPPSRSSSVPARSRAPWSRPSSPGLGADSPNWRRPSITTNNPSIRSSVKRIQRYHHRDSEITSQTDTCPYCHRPWNHRNTWQRRIRNT